MPRRRRRLNRDCRITSYTSSKGTQRRCRGCFRHCVCNLRYGSPVALSRLRMRRSRRARAAGRVAARARAVRAYRCGGGCSARRARCNAAERGRRVRFGRRLRRAVRRGGCAPGAGGCVPFGVRGVGASSGSAGCSGRAHRLRRRGGCSGSAAPPRGRAAARRPRVGAAGTLRRGRPHPNRRGCRGWRRRCGTRPMRDSPPAPCWPCCRSATMRPDERSWRAPGRSLHWSQRCSTTRTPTPPRQRTRPPRWRAWSDAARGHARPPTRRAQCRRWLPLQGRTRMTCAWRDSPAACSRRWRQPRAATRRRRAQLAWLTSVGPLPGGTFATKKFATDAAGRRVLYPPRRSWARDCWTPGACAAAPSPALWDCGLFGLAARSCFAAPRSAAPRLRWAAGAAARLRQAVRSAASLEWRTQSDAVRTRYRVCLTDAHPPRVLAAIARWRSARCSSPAFYAPSPRPAGAFPIGPLRLAQS